MPDAARRRVRSERSPSASAENGHVVHYARRIHPCVETRPSQSSERVGVGDEEVLKQTLGALLRPPSESPPSGGRTVDFRASPGKLCRPRQRGSRDELLTHYRSTDMYT
ncbi:unnamed protein product [Rangifer tarandus platyrhynchus]|uniref:Uncharacterized protein n=1 Tax=Rangifer tarandus platyrhynchus TaxID=3082113 RepID=A0ACB1KG69_RANTA